MKEKVYLNLTSFRKLKFYSAKLCFNVVSVSTQTRKLNHTVWSWIQDGKYHRGFFFYQGKNGGNGKENVNAHLIRTIEIFWLIGFGVVENHLDMKKYRLSFFKLALNHVNHF